MSRSIAGKIKINSFADIVSGDDTLVAEVPLEDLHEFKGHPFYVQDDEKMKETVESIRQHGVLTPGIVRPAADGGYEIISGHRRKRACELAGLTTMPVLIRNYSDDESVIAMVDSNLQREDILPSEKARAYRLKFDAMKHQGGEGGNTLANIGESAGESSKTVQRYIRLSYLTKTLLEYVDTKRIPVRAGVELSYLKEKEQIWVEDAMKEVRMIISPAKAEKIRWYSQSRDLTRAVVRLIIMGEKAAPRKLVIKAEKLAAYFPEDMSSEEIEETVFRLLDEWLKEKNDKE